MSAFVALVIMTGPKDRWGRARRQLALSAVELELDQALATWKAFMGARRALDRLLKAQGVSFAQWRVLHATDRLVREFEDVVGQMEIAQELDLDEGALSDLLRRLLRAGLVDIEPECWRTLNGVLLAPRGEKLLHETRELVLAELQVLLSPIVCGAHEPYPPASERS